MSDRNKQCELSEEDLRSALKELKGFVDITESDLKQIFDLALKHARERATPRFMVRRAMTMEVVTVKPDDSIQHAAELLSRNRISGMPVVDEEDRVLGVIGEADILSIAGLRQESRFKDIFRHLLGEPVPVRKKKGDTVKEVMSSPAITTLPDRDIKEVATILDERRIKRLPVVDENGKLVGVIARADIIRILGRDSLMPVRKRK